MRRLRWGLRRHWMALVIVALVAADVVLFVQRERAPVTLYRSEASVEVGAAARPGLAEEVRREVFAGDEIEMELDEVVLRVPSGQIGVADAPGSVVVHAELGEPDVTRLAAEGAARLVAAHLEQSGVVPLADPRVGEPELMVSTTPAATAAMTAAAALALPLLVLFALTVVRRPVTSPSQAGRAVGGRVLGVVRLPRGRGLPFPHQVQGLSRLAEELFPGGERRWVLVSPPRQDEERSRLAAALAQFASRRGGVWVAELHPLGLLAPLSRVPGISFARRSDAPTSRPVQIVNAPPIRHSDPMTLTGGEAAVAVVAKEGTAARRVRGVARLFPPGTVGGVIYVEDGAPKEDGEESLPTFASEQAPST